MNSLMPFALATPSFAVLVRTGQSETRSALIEWLRVYRDDNRLDEVVMAQLTRLDLQRIEGRTGAEETLLACECAQASGQRMIASLKAKQPPAGLPQEDVRALHLALQTAILMYEHQTLMLDAHQALLTELLPYNGRVENIPADDAEAMPSVFRHLKVMRQYQQLANDALAQSGGFFGAVVTRWNLWDTLIGFG